VKEQFELHTNVKRISIGNRLRRFEPLRTTYTRYCFRQKIRNEWTAMTTIKIITDSSCDLPRSTIEEIGVGIVPLSVQFGEECMPTDMDLADFYAKMKRESMLPKTSSPSPGTS
jgi:hypothetical protein